MEITKIGDNSFYIKGKKENLLINPSEEQKSLKKFDSRMVLLTEERFVENTIDNNRVVLHGPGEYEVGGVDVVGINSGSNSTIYIINIDGVSVCVVGCLKEKLSDKKIEKIEDIDVDVLVAPLDATVLGDGKEVMDWAKKWGANFVVPYNYETQKEALTKFLDAADAEDKTPVESLKLTDKEELPDGCEVVVLA